ncbi:MAG: hypothetical protein Q7S06_01650 [Nanoarchaeota archaeon]|nr:hypothetical protein [Nanoarchaeota archaeon]
MEKDVVETAHNVRSRILNYAIIIEMQLEDFIRDYFVKEDNKKLKFSELIVRKEFFTFEQKINVFEKILEEIKEIKVIYYTSKGEYDLIKNKKDFIKRIRYIREIRNAIAHIHPFRDEGTEDIGIIYPFDNKKKEIILNDKFGMEFFNEYFKIEEILRQLKKELFKK